MDVVLLLPGCTALDALVVRPLLGAGGGGGGQWPKKAFVPKIRLKVPAPLINLIFAGGKIV